MKIEERWSGNGRPHLFVRLNSVSTLHGTNFKWIFAYIVTSQSFFLFLFHTCKKLYDWLDNITLQRSHGDAQCTDLATEIGWKWTEGPIAFDTSSKKSQGRIQKGGKKYRDKRCSLSLN